MLGPVAQQLLHLIVVLMLPAIMKPLSITAHESLLFLVLPTMKLKLTFSSQPDILVLTPDVSLK